MPDLFGSAGVELPEGHRISRRDARKLAERAEDALYADFDDYDARLRAVAREAEQRGAWRVARALRWMATIGAFERHGFDYTLIRTERVIERWLRAIEEG